jgi:hypothetical protein
MITLDALRGSPYILITLDVPLANEMTRRKDTPSSPEDVERVSYRLECRNPKGSHEFHKTGAFLDSNETFHCPECGWPVHLSYDEKLKLYSDTAVGVRRAHELLRKKAGLS